MLDLVQSAAILNMEGACYLEERNEQQALTSFNNALDCMSRAASNYYCTKLIQQVASAVSPDAAQIVVGGQLNSSDNNNSASSGTIPLMAIPKPPDPDQPQDIVMEEVSYKPSDGSCEENPQLFVYAQPLVFNPQVARTAVDSLFYSAVVIFNTALCFHQAGDKADPASYAKAASLYDICLELLKESALRFNCSHVIISAMNNKACIHQSLKEYEKANNVWDQLLSVMLSAKTNPPVFGERDTDGILHNILLLKASCFAQAA